MSGTTANIALPYPTSGDNIAPLETVLKDLADATDAAIAADRVSISALLGSASYKVRAGSTVPTTDGSGQITIATGLTAVTCLVCMNGDNAALGAVVFSKVSTSGGNVVVVVRSTTTGATVNGTTLRVDWVAFGS